MSDADGFVRVKTTEVDDLLALINAIVTAFGEGAGVVKIEGNFATNQSGETGILFGVQGRYFAFTIDGARAVIDFCAAKLADAASKAPDAPLVYAAMLMVQQVFGASIAMHDSEESVTPNVQLH